MPRKEKHTQTISYLFEESSWLQMAAHTHTQLGIESIHTIPLVRITNEAQVADSLLTNAHNMRNGSGICYPNGERMQ